MSKKRATRKKRPPKPADKRKDAAIVFKVEAARKEQYERAADAADLPLSMWIRHTLNAACRQAGIE